MVTALVALDLRAAFDTVWHCVLLHRMLMLNFSPILVKMIRSFLGHRRFSVRLDGFTSEKKYMTAGVPQGSVPGPLLFNLFISNIPINPSINLSQFADDTMLYFTHNNPGLAQGCIYSYINTLVGWFKNWKLKLNKDKTELIHFLGQAVDTNRKLRKNTRKISVDGQLIKPSDNIRILLLIFNRAYRNRRHTVYNTGQ